LHPLISLPRQPSNVDWPTEHWARSSLAQVSPVADQLFDLTPAQGVTYGLLDMNVMMQGRIRYICNTRGQWGKVLFKRWLVFL